MAQMTDCRRRRVRSIGCFCDYCRDNAVLADGEGVRVGIRFSDAAPDASRAWTDEIFDAAGVPVRPDDALSPHEQALRGGMRAQAAEERAKASKEAAEARRQAATGNRTANEGADAWDAVLARHRGGGVREARFSRT